MSIQIPRSANEFGDYLPRFRNANQAQLLAFVDWLSRDAFDVAQAAVNHADASVQDLILKYGSNMPELIEQEQRRLDAWGEGLDAFADQLKGPDWKAARAALIDGQYPDGSHTVPYASVFANVIATVDAGREFAETWTQNRWRTFAALVEGLPSVQAGLSLGKTLLWLGGGLLVLRAIKR